MRLIPLLALTLLAACGEQADTSGNGGEATSPAAGSTPADTATIAPANAIPALFHGPWDAETGTCDPASERRLEIAANSVKFYESLGAVTGVTDAQDGSVLIDLAMEGEGEQWNRSMALKVTGEGEGQRLSLREKGSADYESLTLQRCPT
jgi:hypothetical protein